MPTSKLSSTPRLVPGKFRECVLLGLFACMSQEQDEEGLIASIMHQLKITKARAKEGLARAATIFRASPPLVARLESICHAYRWVRVGKLEQAVLILGAYELIEQQEIPGKVVLAEATRLAKKFSGKESAGFVNAVLDAHWRNATLAKELVWCDPEVDRLAADLQEGAQLQIDREISNLEGELAVDQPEADELELTT